MNKYLKLVLSLGAIFFGSFVLTQAATCAGIFVGGTGVCYGNGYVGGIVAHTVLVGEGSNQIATVTPTSNIGYVLTSNGLSADPTFQAVSSTNYWTSLGNAIYNNTGGSVAINLTNPSADLEVQGTTTNSTIFQAWSDAAANLFNIQDSGHVGIGTTSPSTNLSVQGNGLFSGNLSVANLTATGTVTLGGKLLTHNSNTNTVFNGNPSTGVADIINSAGNWAIRTDTAGGFNIDSAAGASQFTSFTINNHSGNVGIASTSPFARFSIDTSNLGAGVPEFDVGSSTRTDLVVNQNGNVGIGTANPTFPLQVYGTTRIYSSSDPTRYLEISHVTNNSKITAQSELTLSASSGDFIQAGGGTTAYTGSTLGVFQVGGLLTKIGTAIGQVVAPGAGNTSADAYLTTSAGVDATGRRDANKLYFITPSGISPASSNVDAGNGGDIYFKLGAGGAATGSGANGRNGQLVVQRTSESNTLSDFLDFLNTSGTKLASVNNTGGAYFGGNVGIGTTSPFANLSIAGSAGGTTPLFALSTSTSAFATSTVAEIDKNGNAFFGLNGANVGIGTTSPYAQLSVTGNLVLGAATAGGTPGDLYLPKLGTAAGAFLAVDPTGKVIATTTPSGGGGSGTVTSIATNNGLTGGTITTSGTIGLATINAGVLGAVTNGSVPTSQATSTLYGIGIGGQILGWNNGALQFVGTTTAGTGLTYNAGSPGNFSVNTSQSISQLSNLTTNGFVQTTSGNGTLTSAALTSGQVTTALGFTPFGGTNPLPLANGGTATTTGGVTNALEFFNGTTLTNSANFVELANGNIGIGTTTPFASFSIATTSAAAWDISDAFNTIDALFSTASTTGSIFTVAATTSPSILSPIKLFDVDQYGHLTASSTPNAPALSSCGTSPSLATNSNDDTGTIQTGSGGITSCTLTFGQAYATTPTVVISDNSTTAVADVSAVSTTAFTVSFASSLTSPKVYYIVVQP